MNALLCALELRERLQDAGDERPAAVFVSMALAERHEGPAAQIPR